jgi:glycosyltransferase involved in cell wall biosynthesis
MNILYIVQYWPSLFETYMFREVGWMRKRGHGVAIVSLASTGPMGFVAEQEQYVNLAEFNVGDVPVLQLELTRSPRKEILGRALSFARDHDTELIDAHFAREPAEVACDLSIATGIPFTVRLRGGDTHSRTSQRLAEIAERAYALCPVSEFLAGFLTGKRSRGKSPEGPPIALGAGKLQVLPYNLPVEYLAEKPVEQSEEIQVIGSAGRVVPIKRFEDIIQAVSELIDEFPRLKLMIIGGGVTQDLERKAWQAGLGERFEITGFKRWDEVLTLLRRVHIYVQASELEGFCLTTVEAAFQGVPLVLSRTGIHEECVEEGVNGYLFDSGDVGALRESLRRLLKAGAKKREEMGAASIEIVGSRLSEESVMPRIETLFEAAMSSRSPASYAGMPRIEPRS